MSVKRFLIIHPNQSSARHQESRATVTPKADESLRYSEAGLGLRVITLPSDASHDQISQILILEYPMLQSLNGSWMFYKASGKNAITGSIKGILMWLFL